MPPFFDEQKFHADLLAAYKAWPGFSGVFDQAQIRLLDREPAQEDLFTVEPPALFLVPGEWDFVQYGPEVIRIEPYPVHLLILAQTLDASEDSDRWTDASKGAARLSSLVIDAANRLGPNGDGAISLTATGNRCNYALVGQRARPARLFVQDDEGEGTDITVPAVPVNYDLEAS
jgi:hypothetical protein